MSAEAVTLAKGFPTFAAHVTSFSTEDSLVMNKCVFVPENFRAFLRAAMSFLPEKGCQTLGSSVHIFFSVSGLYPERS